MMTEREERYKNKIFVLCLSHKSNSQRFHLSYSITADEMVIKTRQDYLESEVCTRLLY